jgi:hypothetical protein
LIHVESRCNGEGRVHYLNATSGRHKEISMSKAWIIAATLVVAALATPGSAATVGDVIAACDDMHAAGKTCNYGIQGNSLNGCTAGTVFHCPADGSRQCTGGPNTGGKCNDDGTIAIELPLRGDALLNQLQNEKVQMKK